VGEGGTVLATTNGGAKWDYQSLESPEAIQGIAFPDANHGWVVGDGIFATTDGGGSWSSQRSRSSAMLLAVAFPGATHGWVVGSAGAILATSDGGATWTTQESGTTQWLNAVAFADDIYGWVVGDPDTENTILATTDGGATWTAQARVPSRASPAWTSPISPTAGRSAGEARSLRPQTAGLRGALRARGAARCWAA
jgi:photosystem II stability/assembly factor-like uncharacterized protein